MQSPAHSVTGESHRESVVHDLPGLGHVFPTVRTAQAFQAAGHEVLYALGGYVEMTVTAGMAVVDTAPGVGSAGDLLVPSGRSGTCRTTLVECFPTG